MDQRVWQWRSPWEKRTYVFCSLFYLCLLLRQQVTAAETGYSQDSKSDVPDSNKLDAFSSYVPYESKEFDSEYKRGSSFFPLRGKKVPDDLKRASYFMPMRGRRDDDYDITDESLDKRASSFMPMRGKKKYADISDFLSKAGTYDGGFQLNPSSSSGKRMHSFVPVRGKRSYDEAATSAEEPSNHTAFKRSVSFMPMRGRREEEEETPGGIATSLLEKKMQAFMPMRGRKAGDEVGEEFGDVHKKATFMPMRGRKDGGEIGEGMGDMDKKATFMPMRGRKDGGELGEEFGDLDKKATFMPMRGRKDDDYDDWEESKRAQSFMPMRGRRAHLRDVVFDSSDSPGIESKLIEDKRASSFTLMRGRRSLPEDEDVSEDYEDAEKRVAFMPMRGRRLSDDDDVVEVEPWPADQLISLLDKKSSAFMPMRGRRFDYYRNFTVDPWPADQLMSLFNKRSSAFMPMRGRRFAEYRNITVDPWPADQLMSLFDNKRSSAFMPMRGRRGDYYDDQIESRDWEKRGSYFTPMRGRRYDGRAFYNPYPYLMAGMGSSLMSKPFSDQGSSYLSVGSAAERRKKLKINWDAVKRAFHATRGKRGDSYPVFSDSDSPARTKRSILRPRISMPNRQYIALKRPMSFFATRGKRLDDSTLDKLSKLR